MIYHVAGLQLNAIGIFEPFMIEIEADHLIHAERVAREARQTAGREHVLLFAVVPQLETNDAVGKVGDAYWRERFKPGGTIEVDGKVTHSKKADEIFRQMDVVTNHGHKAVTDTLVRIGVPEALVKLTASHEDLILEPTMIRWCSHANGDGYDLDAALTKLDLDLNDVEEWCTGARWVWTDSKRIMVTYCEGDLSSQYHFTDESFAAKFASAAEFYSTH